MKIEKLVTPHFEQYEVYTKVLKNLPQNLWQRITKQQPTVEVEMKLSHIIEADDESGLVVQQVEDGEGNIIYTNGTDDIAIDSSAVKLLLLLPDVRRTFLQSGFKPKLSRTYKENLIIKYRGPIQPDVIIRETVIKESELVEKDD